MTVPHGWHGAYCCSKGEGYSNRRPRVAMCCAMSQAVLVKCCYSGRRPLESQALWKGELQWQSISVSSEEDRKSIVDGLSRLLSDHLRTVSENHNFHWNVTGPSFRTLHLMFEEQYNELALAVDSIAERIRALGFPAPGSYAFYARHLYQGGGRRTTGGRDDPPAGPGPGGRGAILRAAFSR